MTLNIQYENYSVNGVKPGTFEIKKESEQTMLWVKP